MFSIDEVSLSGKRVAVICPWQLEKVSLKFDLFYNAASFQEMEKENVANYLCYAKRIVNGYFFIQTIAVGHKKGAGGQKERISSEFIRAQFDHSLKEVPQPDTGHVKLHNRVFDEDRYDRICFER